MKKSGCRKSKHLQSLGQRLRARCSPVECKVYLPRLENRLIWNTCIRSGVDGPLLGLLHRSLSLTHFLGNVEKLSAAGMELKLLAWRLELAELSVRRCRLLGDRFTTSERIETLTVWQTEAVETEVLRRDVLLYQASNCNPEFTFRMLIYFYPWRMVKYVPNFEVSNLNLLRFRHGYNAAYFSLVKYSNSFWAGKL